MLLTDDVKRGDFFLNKWRRFDQSFQSAGFQRDFAKHYALSSSLDVLLIGFDNTNAARYDRDGRLLQNLHNHSGIAAAVAITPDARRLAVYIDRRFLYVWERKKNYEDFSLHE